MTRKVHTLEQTLNKRRQVEIAVANSRGVAQAVREIGVGGHTHPAS